MGIQIPSCLIPKRMLTGDLFPSPENGTHFHSVYSVVVVVESV